MRKNGSETGRKVWAGMVHTHLIHVILFVCLFQTVVCGCSGGSSAKTQEESVVECRPVVADAQEQFFNRVEKDFAVLLVSGQRPSTAGETPVLCAGSVSEELSVILESRRWYGDVVIRVKVPCTVYLGMDAQWSPNALDLQVNRAQRCIVVRHPAPRVLDIVVDQRMRDVVLQKDDFFRIAASREELLCSSYAALQQRAAGWGMQQAASVRARNMLQTALRDLVWDALKLFGAEEYLSPADIIIKQREEKDKG